jgi:hypothetical protein
MCKGTVHDETEVRKFLGNHAYYEHMNERRLFNQPEAVTTEQNDVERLEAMYENATIKPVDRTIDGTRLISTDTDPRGYTYTTYAERQGAQEVAKTFRFFPLHGAESDEESAHQRYVHHPASISEITKEKGVKTRERVVAFYPPHEGERLTEYEQDLLRANLAETNGASLNPTNEDPLLIKYANLPIERYVAREAVSQIKEINYDLGYLVALKFNRDGRRDELVITLFEKDVYAPVWSTVPASSEDGYAPLTPSQEDLVAYLRRQLDDVNDARMITSGVIDRTAPMKDELRARAGVQTSLDFDASVDTIH